MGDVIPFPGSKPKTPAKGPLHHLDDHTLTDAYVELDSRAVLEPGDERVKQVIETEMKLRRISVH